MAERFRTNGAAAYDIYTTRGNTAQPLPRPKKLPEEPKPQPQKRESRDNRTGRRSNTYVYQPPKPYSPDTGDAFEDMMARFKRSSDDKISDLTRVIDNRRGGNSRRSKK